jgi:NADPH2:quinone reductase
MSQESTMLPSRWMLRNSITLQLFFIYDIPTGDRQAVVAGLGSMLKQGRLNHAVHAVLPLEEIVAAHEMVERGEALGNVVLRINSDDDVSRQLTADPGLRRASRREQPPEN